MQRLLLLAVTLLPAASVFANYELKTTISVGDQVFKEKAILSDDLITMKKESSVGPSPFTVRTVIGRTVDPKSDDKVFHIQLNVQKTEANKSDTLLMQPQLLVLLGKKAEIKVGNRSPDGSTQEASVDVLLTKVEAAPSNGKSSEPGIKDNKLSG